MNPGFIKRAFLLRRNLIALLGSFIVMNIAISRQPIVELIAANPDLTFAGIAIHQFALYAVSLAIYGGFVAQSLLSRAFKEDYDNREMINDIKRTYEDCRQSSKVLKRKLEPTAQQRLDNMMRESEEILQSFLNGDKNYLKVRAVQQSQKLTSAYIKLADMFRVRALASSKDRISVLAKRINTNTSNLNNVRDSGIASELQRVIDADERMIESLKNEKLELDKIDARLQYMESSIGML